VSSAGPAWVSSDAEATLSTLFPGTELRQASRRAKLTAPERSFTIAPSVHHPRLLVPRYPRAAAAVALRSYGGRLSPKARWGYRGMTAAMRVTGGRSLGPTLVVTAPDGVRRPGIDDHLGAVLGERVGVAALLSRPRANRKPVLQALVAGQADPAAFVKMGINRLTRELVGREADALTRLGSLDLGAIRVPVVLDHGEFNGDSVLTLETLPTWQPGRLPHDDELATAAATIAASGPRTCGELRESELWGRLCADLDELPATPLFDRLRQARDSLAERATAMDVETGASHGDWSPWNMWHTRGRLLVWDWERFATGVPVGSDLVHYHLQELLVVRRLDFAVAARAVIDAAPQRLRSSVPDPEVARITAISHLLTLAIRYERDGQAAAGLRFGRTEDWLVPVIEASLAVVRHRPRM
jgi:hypothetical protein